LRDVTPNIGQRHQTTGQQDTHRVQPPQKGDDDRGEPVAHVEIDGDLPRRTRDLEHPCQTGQQTRHAHAEQNQSRRVHTGKPRRPRRLPGHADGKAQPVPRQ
jgi:hypothetical protein